MSAQCAFISKATTEKAPSLLPHWTAPALSCKHPTRPDPTPPLRTLHLCNFTSDAKIAFSEISGRQCLQSEKAKKKSLHLLGERRNKVPWEPQTEPVTERAPGAWSRNLINPPKLKCVYQFPSFFFFVPIPQRKHALRNEGANVLWVCGK